MAGLEPISPQTIADSDNNFTPGSLLPSSPPLPLPGDEGSSKPKKNPTVTPRTFTRFFTPRSSLVRGKKIGASRQALQEITASATNRQARRASNKETKKVLGDTGDEILIVSKKRKARIPASPDTTPDRSSPLKRIRNQSLKTLHDDGSEDTQSGPEDSTHSNDTAVLSDSEEKDFPHSRNIRPISSILNLRKRWPSTTTLARELGILEGSRGYRYVHSGTGVERLPRENKLMQPDWQNETTNFYTRPEGIHVCDNVDEPQEQAIPFCTTSCNTNSLIAIGDEEGGVRLLETAKDGKPEFSKAYLKFRPHANAILDLTFSPDDLLLATASGDQTAQVVDMPTQRPNHILAGHASSVKQVRFQPGSSSVLATSSRDGSVQIWDLRCKGLDGPVQSIKTSFEPGNDDTTRKSSSTSKVTWARPVNSIYFAHSNQTTTLANSTATSKHGLTKDNPSKTESSSRRGDVSITALSFLHPGQEHLLLTASEADASVKLWDLRRTHNHRRHRATPLSTTCQPDSHSKHRKFGITSLALSGDGGRLYTLCRDNTIYTYATSHLILGQALELSSNASRPRRSAAQEKEGIGPIYGFRHPNFRATTFYVKSALRPVANNKTELLAVGSSDGCVVLFPTDERYTQQKSPNEKNSSSDPSPFCQTPKRTSRCRIGSAAGFSTRLDDTIPIHQYGSALISGHSREVTGLTWTLGGDLVTVGDDLIARCWREGEQSEARDLRIGGEGEGRRWGCGWAKAESGWDDEDS